LVTRLAAEQVDREPARRRAAVHHHAVALREQLGTPLFELLDLRPEVQGARAEHLEHGLDLALVVDRTRLRDLVTPDLTHAGSEGRPLGAAQLDPRARR